MKTLYSYQTIIALAVAVAVSASHVSLANAQPAPPNANDSALPANIPPGSPVAEVVKLVQSGVDVGIIKNYIANSASTFNLDADKIISLTDAGVPTDIVNAMMEHDKNYSATAATSAPAPASDQNNSVATAPPAAPVTVEYFNNTLTPYGSWVEVEGYGRCWRPTTVIYDSGWQPYCDRGHWVYTDCGWYWDSDYSWGATFHYGRWFRHSRFGWCWYPDTVWAPSWVSWRSSDAYCGWAPLPPFAVYRPGFGFFYRGAGVAIGFDFGLSADCYTFVSFGHFNERHPRYYREEPGRVRQIFNQTTIINNYGNNNTTIVNHGIPVDRVRSVTHRSLQPVTVAQLPNASRQGWRGDNSDRSSHQPGQGAPNNVGGTTHRQNSTQPTIHNNTVNPTTRPTTPEQPGNHNNSRDRENGNRNSNPSGAAPQNMNPPANNNHASGSPYNREQPQRSTPPITRVTPEHSQPQITPPQHSTPQIEQRQFTPPPAAPVQPSHSAPSVEPRIEQHQSRVESTPRSYTPPSPPRQSPAPSPAPIQPRSSERGSDKDRDK